MLLNAADATDAFGSDSQRVALVWGLIIGKPEMHDTIADDHILCPYHVCPFFTAQFGEKTRTYRPIVILRCR